jgi:hypothetical protein
MRKFIVFVILLAGRGQTETVEFRILKWGRSRAAASTGASRR